MCQKLGVSRSGYYDWRSRAESMTARCRRELTELIREEFARSRGTYGCRRLAAALRRRGITVSVGLVWAFSTRPWSRCTAAGSEPWRCPSLTLRGIGSRTERRPSHSIWSAHRTVSVGAAWVGPLVMGLYATNLGRRLLIRWV